MKSFEDILKVLRGVGSVIAPFNPAVGSGIVLASDALSSFSEFDDTSLEEQFSGLSSLAAELKHMAETGEYDSKKIDTIAASLETLSVVLSKFSKMVG